MSDITESINYGENAHDYFTPIEVPPNVIFRPNEEKIKNSEKKLTIGTAKVVAGVNMQDDFTGFSGRKLTMSRNNSDTSLRSAPSVLRLESSRRNSPGSGITRELSTKSPNAGAVASSVLSRSRTVVVSPMDRTPQLEVRSANDTYGNLPIRGKTIAYGAAQQRTANFTRGRFNSVTNAPSTLSPGSTDPPTIKVTPNSYAPEGPESQRDRFLPIQEVTSSSLLQPVLNNQTETPKTNSVFLDESYMPEKTSKVTDINRRPSAPVQTLSAPTTTLKREATTPSSSIKIKCHFYETRFVIVPRNTTFEELRTRISNKFGVTDKLQIQYRDESGVLIWMDDDEGLQDAIFVSDSSRLEVWCFVDPST